MMKSSFAAAALLLVSTLPVGFAQPKSPLTITDIKASFESTPEFNISIGPQRKAPSQNWLWIEVAFTYEPPQRDAPPIDELTLNYYVLLNNAGPQNPTGTLLTGTVIHTGVTPGSDVHRSVMLVAPQTMKRYFGGKIPPNANSVFQAVGVTASVQGQLAGELSIGKGKGRAQWWTQFQQGPPGLVLSKDQTPFAPLFYDYFEAIKGKGPGSF